MTDMKEGLVSIITPMYKGAALVGEAIESVLAQTYRDWEMIIVDDCSPDGGAGIAVVRGYAEKDGRVRLIASPVNKGSSGARNIGLREAKGRYVAFLDSDDVWYPGLLESQLAFMAEKKAAVVTSSFLPVERGGRGTMKPFIVPARACYKDLLKACAISCLTTLYDRESVGEHYFREEMRSLRDDYAFWLEIMKATDYAYGNPEILAEYRLQPGSATHDKMKVIRSQFMVYYRIEGLGLLRSVYYLMNWAVWRALKYR